MENLENLARELELSFGENEGVYIGVWPATFWRRWTGHLDGFVGEVHDLCLISKLIE